jgi:hypothetical protein
MWPCNSITEAPEILGRIDLGMQLYSGNGFEVKAGYTADIGESFLGQSASGRIAYRLQCTSHTRPPAAVART